METLPDGCTLHTAESRPDLWETLKDPHHPLKLAWPEFLAHDIAFKRYHSKLKTLSSLARFQFAIVERTPEDEDDIIATGHSVPFFWPDLEQSVVGQSLSHSRHLLDTLPDGGYSSVLARGVHQAQVQETPLAGSTATTVDDENLEYAIYASGERPNALSAISIAVRANRRQRGLAEALIMAMRNAARKEELRALVVPLRPTAKGSFPDVDMSEYVKWKLRPVTAVYPSVDHREDSKELPFDPWLRKHVRLGGEIVKIAKRSMVVTGTADDWWKWAGIDLRQQMAAVDPIQVKGSPEAGERYFEFKFAGGLNPGRYYMEKDLGVYVEPNIWVYHDVWSRKNTRLETKHSM
ncbi:hypothetical protein HFD88_000081 [Aspergillus terreus]|nr:hypothetical protein HFD88_000081 [Aspergillus terreus]